MSKGSHEAIQFLMEHTKENLQILKDMSAEISKDGWKWFTDYYYKSGESPGKIQVSVYRKELVPIIKEYLVGRLL
jgi:hypothetical protein